MGKASLLLVVPLGLLLLLPLSRPASVVTHLPGFHGRLPFHLETGYVSVDEETGAELFYYFVESERSPDTDPLILWMTGGPFCSGMIFFEVGPLKFVLAPYNGSLPKLTYNPYSWSKTASIILLDSPVGTGFSYARDLKGYRDIGDLSFSLHVLIFLNKWFINHPRYQSNPFFVGGSSYAGKMSAIIAQHISQEIEQGKQPRINLKGYLVGNPVTGSDYDDNFRVPYAHGVGIISDQLYEAAMQSCKGSYIRPTDKMCDMVLNTIQNLMSEIDVPQILGVNCIRGMLTHRYLSEEYTQLSDPSPKQPTLDCFAYRYYLCNIWANDNSTRDALGVKQGTTGEFVRCKKSIPYASSQVPCSINHHFNLTSRGYRALVFRWSISSPRIYMC